MYVAHDRVLMIIPGEALVLGVFKQTKVEAMSRSERMKVGSLVFE